MGQRLGQHFLRDARVLEDIVTAADLQAGHTVLEVGPGPGNLTECLSTQVGAKGRVVAVEADRGLAEALIGRWPNVQIVHGDAVQVDLAAHGAPVRFDRIVANLPYLISGPITVRFLDWLADPATRWERAVLMYQAEFAQRLLAQPGSGDYGRLTVHAARRVRTAKVRDVPPGCFDPPPKVDSMVVTLQPHLVAPFDVGDERIWRAVVDGPFQQRRKTIRNTIPAAVAGLGVLKEAALEALDALGALGKRPQELAPEEFASLSRALSVARRPLPRASPRAESDERPRGVP